MATAEHLGDTENQNQKHCSAIRVAGESQKQEPRQDVNSETNSGPSLQDEYREWLDLQDEFKVQDFYQYSNLKSRAGKKAVSKVNTALLDQGILERVGSRGVFRVKRIEAPELDWWEADEQALDVSFPLGIENLVNIQPGNVIIFAGEPNSGKTAFLMDVAMRNAKNFNIHYFSSEMGPQELKARIFGFRDEYPNEPVIETFRKISFKERADHFADVIVPGEGNINLIDFLEIHDDFFKIGAYLAQIHHRLDGALAVVALQKDRGKDFGRGGMTTAEKARLYVNLKYDPANQINTAQIIKAKSWKNPQINPNYMKMDFKLFSGARIETRTGCRWATDAKPLRRN
jgi:hypothetical protein